MNALELCKELEKMSTEENIDLTLQVGAELRRLHTENTALLATEYAPAVQGEPVAYLDIGAVGYIDLGTDLSTEQLQALPAGRHMLGIIGTFGANGYVPAPQQKPLTASKEASNEH